MPKLSHMQRHTLEALAKSHSYQEGWGCTNRTMAALEKLGLAKFHWDNPMRSAFGKWKITAAGRQCLAQQ